MCPWVMSQVHMSALCVLTPHIRYTWGQFRNNPPALLNVIFLFNIIPPLTYLPYSHLTAFAPSPLRPTLFTGPRAALRPICPIVRIFAPYPASALHCLLVGLVVCRDFLAFQSSPRQYQAQPVPLCLSLSCSCFAEIFWHVNLFAATTHYYFPSVFRRSNVILKIITVINISLTTCYKFSPHLCNIKQRKRSDTDRLTGTLKIPTISTRF